MAKLPSETAQDTRGQTISTFLIGAILMFPWPVLCAVLQPQKDPTQFLLYTVGAFFLLFMEPLERLSDSMSNISNTWSNVLGFSILGLMLLMWVAILFLPFFGSWNRKVAVLWITQFSYAAAQAICGWFFAQQHL